MTFKHSGDLGDIIWSLPAVKALGGGTLYLDSDGGWDEPCVNNALLFRGGRGQSGRTRTTKLSQEMITSITPVLMQQPYITSVIEWSGQAVEANLDTFRIYVSDDRTLVSSHCEAMVVPEPPVTEPWMFMASAPSKAPIVSSDYVHLERTILLSRSLRYHGNDEFWIGLRPDVQERACFVGLPFEYEVFTRVFPHIKVPYYETPTLLDLFRAVASCERTITNQGLVHCFAEALKKPVVLEVYRGSRRCVFERPGAVYV